MTKIPSLAINRIVSQAVNFFSSTTARKALLAACDQGVISLGNFIAAIFLARAVDPTEFGVYAVGFLLLHFIRAIQDGLIIQPMNAFGPTLHKAEFRAFFTRNFVLQAVLAIMSAVFVGFGGWLLTRLGNDTAGPTLFALWFVYITWQLQEFFRRTFYIKGTVSSAVLISGFSNICRLLFLVNLNTKQQLTGIDGINAIAWGSLFASVLGAWQVRRYWTWIKVDFQSLVKFNWQYGKWVLGGSVANWAAAEIYPIMAAGLVSFAAAGAYRAVQQLVAPVHVLLRAIDTFSTPRAAAAYQTKGVPGITRILKYIYLVSILPILGLLVLVAIFPKTLLNILYGGTYLEFSNGVILMAGFYILWFSYWPLLAALKATRITKPLFTANLTAIVSMLTIGVVAILRWNVYGAIAGQALSAGIISAILWSSWIRKIKNNSYRHEETPSSQGL